MVAGRAGGIPTQLEHGRHGYLAKTVDDFCTHVVEILEQPVRARELATEGMRHVRERFLLPRLLHDRLRLLRDLSAGGLVRLAE